MTILNYSAIFRPKQKTKQMKQIAVLLNGHVENATEQLMKQMNENGMKAVIIGVGKSPQIDAIIASRMLDCKEVIVVSGDISDIAKINELFDGMVREDVASEYTGKLRDDIIKTIELRKQIFIEKDEKPKQFVPKIIGDKKIKTGYVNRPRQKFFHQGRFR